MTQCGFTYQTIKSNTLYQLLKAVPTKCKHTGTTLFNLHSLGTLVHLRSGPEADILTFYYLCQTGLRFLFLFVCRITQNQQITTTVLAWIKQDPT